MINNNQQLMPRPKTVLLALNTAKCASCPKMFNTVKLKEEWEDQQKAIIKTLTRLSLNRKTN